MDKVQQVTGASPVLPTPLNRCPYGLSVANLIGPAQEYLPKGQRLSTRPGRLFPLMALSRAPHERQPQHVLQLEGPNIARPLARQAPLVPGEQSPSAVAAAGRVAVVDRRGDAQQRLGQRWPAVAGQRA